MNELIDWSKIYENGKCPDCERNIPKDAQEGDECKACGHIFWKFQAIVEA